MANSHPDETKPNNRMKHVIILGASGNIATNVIDLVSSRDDIKLTLFVRNKRNLRSTNASNCRIIEGNVLTYEQLKAAIAGQAWLMAQKPWIVPIPGTTQMAHMVENSSADGVRFTSSEITELNSAVSAIEIRGQRLPDAVLVFSGVEAPAKKNALP
jgi:hypothetical protein